MVLSQDELSKAVGRLLLGRLPGTKLDTAAKKSLSDGTMGGVVIFKENAESVEQLMQLNADIYKASHHPAVIATDQEGGAVQRFDHILTPLPSAMALAACDDIAAMKKVVEISVSQLKSVGINMLLAPVLDVLTNALNPVIATRAFSSDPKKVAELGNAFLTVCQEEGMVGVAKHFPGHGSTLEDSHADLAVNPFDTKTLWQMDLMPFRHCKANTKAILTGHIWLSSVDQEPLPASLSKLATQSILRDYLDFKGLVVTDDMTMKAVSDKWGMGEAAAMAIEAGADLILLCGSVKDTLEAHAHIVKQVKEGRISEERIKASLARIDELFPKPKKTQVFKPMEADELKKFKTSIKKSRTTTLATATNAVCVLRGAVPRVHSGNWLVLVPNHSRYPMNLNHFLTELCAKGTKTNPDQFKKLSFSEIRYSLDPATEESEEIAKECTERNAIFVTYRSLANQGQMRLGGLLADHCRDLVAIASDVPFDLIGLPGVKNCLSTLDPSDLAMEAVARVLLQLNAPKGVCPVSLEFQLITRR